MSNIKIFVSQRIDLDSELIENPLYYNVRCGAVYDQKSNVAMAGDTTGDNISEKRLTYNELTVQYWAWKNVRAEYYGLCHYRRYLSFSDKLYHVNPYNMVIAPHLNGRSKKKYRLDDPSTMRAVIESYDAIVPRGADVTRMLTQKGYMPTVYQHWMGHEDEFIYGPSLEMLLILIDRIHPEYLVSAREYFAGTIHYGYNCYVMRESLFNELCTLQFDILPVLEKELEDHIIPDAKSRAPGYMGEILFGIFVYHIIKSRKYRIKENQLIFFYNTKKDSSFFRNISIFCLVWICEISRGLINILLPMNSKRRQRFKNMYACVLRWKRN